MHAALGITNGCTALRDGSFGTVASDEYDVVCQARYAAFSQHTVDRVFEPRLGVFISNVKYLREMTAGRVDQAPTGHVFCDRVHAGNLP